MRRLLALLAALLLLFGAAACSEDEEPEASEETTEQQSSDEEATEDEEATDEEATEDEEATDEDAADATEEDYVDALVANLTEDGEESPVTEDEGQCMAEGIVEIVGVDELKDAGVTPDQFAEDGPNALGTTIDQGTADEIAAAFMDCLESPGAFLAMAMGVTDEAGIACVEENVDEAALEEFIAAAMLAEEGSDPPPEMMAMFEEIAAACPEAMGSTTG